jgi:long-subunit fatty acid transport protein
VKHASTLLSLAVLAAALPARAQIEPPAVHGARSAALGGTGVAYADDATAVFHNPAALDAIGRIAVTIGASPQVASSSAPIRGPDLDPVPSSRAVFPYFFAGGALRLHERVVVGLAAYPTAGGTVHFATPHFAGHDLSATVSAIEISPALSFAVTRDLALGLAYRVTAAASLHREGSLQGGQLVSADTTMRGWGFRSMSAGIAYRVHDRLRLGLLYRSRAAVDVSGTRAVTVGDEAAPDAVSWDAKSTVATPHTLRIGAAAELLPETLTVALELGYRAYGSMLPRVSTTLTSSTGATKVEFDRPDLRDEVGVGFGLEAKPIPELALRLGYHESSSPTSPDKPSWSAPPPGARRTFTWGAGVSLPRWDAGLAGMYTFASAETSGGTYATNALTLALSVTYRQ